MGTHEDLLRIERVAVRALRDLRPPVEAGQLAARLGEYEPATEAMLERLEARGLVRRVPRRSGWSSRWEAVTRR